MHAVDLKWRQNGRHKAEISLNYLHATSFNDSFIVNFRQMSRKVVDRLPYIFQICAVTTSHM